MYTLMESMVRLGKHSLKNVRYLSCLMLIRAKEIAGMLQSHLFTYQTMFKSQRTRLTVNFFDFCYFFIHSMYAFCYLVIFVYFDLFSVTSIALCSELFMTAKSEGSSSTVALSFASWQ